MVDETNPTLPELVYDWFQESPIDGIRSDGSGTHIVDFRCCCPVPNLVGTAYQDHVMIWSNGEIYRDISFSYRPYYELHPSDPLFFNKLRDMLLAKTLRCKNGPLH
jgi:hypothetical protein